MTILKQGKTNTFKMHEPREFEEEQQFEDKKPTDDYDTHRPLIQLSDSLNIKYNLNYEKEKQEDVIDADNQLSYTRLQNVINQKYPRELQFNKDATQGKVEYKVHRICCGTNVGWLHCKRSRRHSDLKNYGVGIVLYFQIQKYLITLLGILTILNLPLMYAFS